MEKPPPPPSTEAPISTRREVGNALPSHAFVRKLWTGAVDTIVDTLGDNLDTVTRQRSSTYLCAMEMMMSCCKHGASWPTHTDMTTEYPGA